MPSLGADMEAGTLLEWRVAIGDEVHRGDIVALVDTEKSAIEMESFIEGVVEELLVSVGTKVPVGTPLARLRGEGEEARPAAPPSQAPTPPPRMSPVARRRARELGLDPATLTGSGPEGVVTLSDVERAAAPAKTPEKPADRGARLRGAVAAAMARSNREVPHYYLASTVPMAAARAFLERENTRRSVQESVLPVALFVRAVALALREHRALNGVWRDGALVQKERIHVGMVVSIRGGGVMVPAVKDADAKSLDEVMGTLRDLVQRARTGGLKSSELSEGTITVTNLGERAPEAVYGVVFPPQVALVGIGGVVERPWVVDGEVRAQPVCTITLAADHRATDGHLGGRFLSEVARLIESPERL